MSVNVKGLVLILTLMLGCILSSSCIFTDFLSDKATDIAVNVGEKGADKLDAIWVEKMKETGIIAENFDANKNGKLEMNEMLYFSYALNNANKQKEPKEQKSWWMIMIIALLGGWGTNTPSRTLYKRILGGVFGEVKKYTGIGNGPNPSPPGGSTQA